MTKNKSKKSLRKNKLNKKKLSSNSKKELEMKDENKEIKRKAKKPAEGSRFAAVALLLVTILVSLGFYLYGVVTQKGISIEFGEMENSWEYSK